MRLRIERIALGGEALLSRIAADVFDGPVDPQRLRRLLADPSHVLVIACDGGLVVGQGRATVQHHPDAPSELYVGKLAVAPLWRRRGVATALVDALLDAGRAAGCTSAWIGTEPDNAAANALYARYGRGEAANIFMFGL